MSRDYRGVIDLATGRPIEPPNPDDDRVLAIADSDPGPLLPIKECLAQCQKIEGPRAFTRYEKNKLIFHWRIIDPPEFLGTVLKSYVTCSPEWMSRYVPRSATLYKYLCVALGREPKQADRIIKKLWKDGHVFRCKVKSSRTVDGKLHSVIEGLISKHA